MNDYTELKRLAEAAPNGPWVAENDSLYFKDDGYTRHLMDADAGHDVQDDAYYAALNFIAAANPAAVLALIAENEQLHESDQEATELCDTLSVLLGEIAVAVRGPEEPKSRHGFHDLPSRVKTVVAERDQLKAENERLRADYAGLARFNPEWDRVAAAQDSVREHMAMVVQLKAENAGLRTGYEAYERVNAELKAENDALRDDLEQIKYDANAWRNGEESVWIEVFNSEGDDPFICAISGQITVEQLALIQAEILEYREDYFEKGSGLYVFRCAHYQAHYDNVGMTEPAHWETDFESYSPFPWEEEAAALGQGEQS